MPVLFSSRISIKKTFSNPYVIITGLISVVYFQTIFFGLVFLDDFDIISNPLSKVANSVSIKDVLLSKYLGGQYYRPVTKLSFYINAYLGGEQLYIYHLTNVFIHMITALLLYKLLLKLKYSNAVSIFFTALFAVHPLFINAVVWIAGRNDLLIGLFCTAGFLFLVNYKEKLSTLFIYVFFLLLAFASKESSVLFPFVCIAYSFLLRKDKGVYPKEAYTFLISIGSVSIYFLFRFLISSFVSVNKHSLEDFFKNIRIIPETVSKIIFPFNLKVLPDFDFWLTASGILILLIIMALPFFVETISRKIYFFGIIWFILLMFPGMLVRTMTVDGGFQYWDCRAYLPAIGLFISFSEAASKIKIKYGMKFSYGTGAAVILILSMTNIGQSRLYKNPVAFWQSAINDYPKRALFYKGIYSYYNQSKQYDNALGAIKTALTIDPGNLDYSLKALNICIKGKKLDEAKKIIDQALLHNPGQKKLIFYKANINSLVYSSNVNR